VLKPPQSKRWRAGSTSLHFAKRAACGGFSTALEPLQSQPRYAGIDIFLTPSTLLLITRRAANGRFFGRHYERFDFHRRDRRVLPRERAVRPALRKTLGDTMENIIVGVIALLLFAYLLVAMLRPEKF
jgi:K+-transporting ATPase KdpF subunit